jgi:hypothetical protein
VKSALIEHFAEINGGVGAGEFKLELVGFTERFYKIELQHIKSHAAGGLEGEAQVGLTRHKTTPEKSTKKVLNA